MVFKGCGRCSGDMYREEDIGQTDLVCLQCGYRMPAEPVAVFRRPAQRERQTRGRPTGVAA